MPAVVGRLCHQHTLQDQQHTQPTTLATSQAVLAGMPSGECGGYAVRTPPRLQVQVSLGIPMAVGIYGVTVYVTAPRYGCTLIGPCLA
jgi:hypothetical protein